MIVLVGKPDALKKRKEGEREGRREGEEREERREKEGKTERNERRGEGREKEKRKTKRKQLSTPEKTKVAKENKQSQCCCALQYLPCCNI